MVNDKSDHSEQSPASEKAEPKPRVRRKKAQALEAQTVQHDPLSNSQMEDGQQAATAAPSPSKSTFWLAMASIWGAARSVPSAWRTLQISGVIVAVGYFVLIAQDFSTDIVFRVQPIPSALVDAGINAEYVLQRAVDEVPSRKAHYRRQVDDSTHEMSAVPRQISVGVETYCSNSTFKRLVSLAPSYYEREKTLRTAQEMNSRWFSFPGAEWLIDIGRKLLGKPYMVVTMSIYRTEQGYELETVADAVSGAEPEDTHAAFRKAILAPNSTTISALFEEAVLRFSYPELMTVVRNVKTRSDLDIEEFLSRAYPSTDGLAMVNFGIFVALLNSPDGTNPSKSFKRAATAGRLALNTSDLINVEFNKDELELAVVRATKMFMVGSEVMHAQWSAMFEGEEDEIIEKYAANSGYDFAALSSGKDVNYSFDPATRPISEIFFATRMVRAGNADGVAAYRERLDKMLAVAKEDETELLDPDVRVALRDSIMIYGGGVSGLVRPTQLADTTSDSALRSYIKFHDEVLSDLLSKSNLLTEDENSFLELVVISAQLKIGNVNDAIFRAKHLYRNASPCPLLQAADTINTLAEPLASNPDDQRQLKSLSLSMAQKAERDGLRNFTVYNTLGLIAGRNQEFNLAQSAFQTAVAYNGEKPWAYLNAGGDYLTVKSYPEAQEAFERSLRASWTHCKDDSAQWNDIDGIYNAIMTKIYSAKVASDHNVQLLLDALTINHDTSERECSIPYAVFGLLESQKMQDDVSGFVRTYREHLSRDVDYARDSDSVRASVLIIRGYQCEGKLEELPPVAPDLAKELRLENGKFACEM